MSEKDFDAKITTSWFDKNKFNEFEICYCRNFEIANKVRNQIEMNLQFDNGYEVRLIGTLSLKRA